MDNTGGAVGKIKVNITLADWFLEYMEKEQEYLYCQIAQGHKNPEIARMATGAIVESVLPQAVETRVLDKYGKV